MKRSHVWVTVVAGANLMLASLAGLFVPAQAQTDTGSGGVGGYTLNASAAATRQIFRPENNILPTENLIDLSVPYATTQLSQGSAHAIGATSWPGDTFANACVAFPDGFPSKTDPNFEWYPPDAPRIPIPCYEYRAESFYPQGPADGKPAQEVAGSTMVSHAEEKEATAKGEFSPQGVPGASIGGMSSDAKSSIKTGVAVAESVSRVSNIVLGGGTVVIESVVSTAKATSDGAAADAKGSTVVQGFFVAGVPVTVTGEGVSVAGTVGALSPLAPVVDPVSAALETLGIKIALSQPIVTKEGAVSSVQAGGLIISFDNSVVISNIPPEVKANFPADPTGRTTLAFGQASASADASPGFADDLAIEEDVPLISDVTETPPAEFVAGDSVAVSTEVPSVAAPAVPSARVRAAGAVAPLDGKAVGLGLVLLAMAGAVAVAAGMHRLATGLFQPIPVTTCTQEKP